MPDSNDLPKAPLIKESSTLFQNSIVHIQCDMLQKDSQLPYPYYTLKVRPFAVILLVFTRENKILTIQEYRHPTQKFLLSFPAGYVETGEDPLVAAERELLEETGYQADTFEILGQAYPYAGISGQKNIYIRASGASYLQPPQLEKSEIIETLIMSRSEIDQQILSGADLDANLLTALALNDYKN